MTGEPLASAQLFSNTALQAIIDDLFPRAVPTDMVAEPEQSLAGMLPLEILMIVARYLRGADLLSCVQVCQQWRQLIYFDDLWNRAILVAFGTRGMYARTNIVVRSSYTRFRLLYRREMDRMKEKCKKRSLPKPPERTNLTGLQLVPTRPASHVGFKLE